jgi:hypothetical protein
MKAAGGRLWGKTSLDCSVHLCRYHGFAGKSVTQGFGTEVKMGGHQLGTMTQQKAVLTSLATRSGWVLVTDKRPLTAGQLIR